MTTISARIKGSDEPVLGTYFEYISDARTYALLIVPFNGASRLHEYYTGSLLGFCRRGMEYQQVELIVDNPSIPASRILNDSIQWPAINPTIHLDQ